MPRIERLRSTTCRIPTDAPESDGTLAWDATTIVVVEVGNDPQALTHLAQIAAAVAIDRAGVAAGTTSA